MPTMDEHLIMCACVLYDLDREENRDFHIVIYFIAVPKLSEVQDQVPEHKFIKGGNIFTVYVDLEALGE